MAGHTERPLRVLHVGKFYPPHAGGMESHLQVLAEALLAEVEIEVLVANDERRTITAMVNSVPVVRAGTWAEPAGAPLSPGMVGRLRDARADLVHLHLPHPGAILAYFASGNHLPLVATYHSDIVRQRVLGWAFEPILQRTLRRCRAIVVSSERVLASSPVLLRHRERCRVVPFGIPLAPFQAADPQEVAAIRERWGARIVLGVGRLVYYKGWQHLIRAMTEVDAVLLLVGDGPLRRELQAEVERLGLTDRVHLLGKVEKVVPFYHAARCFVLPSVARSEAFGIVQLEAMAAGTPVVNTALDSGVPSVSLDGETGLTVPPADPAALSAAVRRILDDPLLREHFGRAARIRAEREFSAERMAQRTLAVYDEVLQRR